MGLQAALPDLARSGRPAAIGDDSKAWLKSQARVKPKELGHARELWTIEKLASHVHDACVEAGHGALSAVSPSKVWMILEEDELEPRRIQHRLERRDPGFERKMNEILMACKEAELLLAGERTSGGIIVPYDEKPGMQAIANVAPDLPPKAGRGCVTRDYEHERLGTVSLLAGLDLMTGEVPGLTCDAHKSSNFIDFLKMIDNKYKNDDHIKIALGNHTVHASKETRKYLDTKPSIFIFIFTPEHGSWLNLVESFFGKLTRACLKGIRAKTKDELISMIYQHIDEINCEPIVYRWTFKMDEIQL
jgi:transposase